MRIVQFYGHFAAAFGSLWILFFVLAFVTQSRIDLGALGFFGFPIVSATYAYLRMKQYPPLQSLILDIGRKTDVIVGKIRK